MSAEPTRRRRRRRNTLAFIFFLSLVSLSTSDELQVLLDFKSAIGKSNAHVLDTWRAENSVCNFTGILCDAGQTVKEINLPQQRLSGTVPFDSICSLQSLERLSLGSNSLYGGINEGISNCTKLQYLDLGQNSFAGEVPDLSALSRLKFLNLNHSGFSGQFPWKSLENMTSLEFLSLGDNPFEESAFPVEVLTLEKLYWLYLSNCSLQGEIPEGIGNLTLLQNMELSDNYLTGKIPEGVAKLKKLWQLELYTNELTGKLPAAFGNLTGLVILDASTNKLEGDLLELKSLTQLQWLQLFENRFSGEIPAEFGGFRSLQKLSLYTNMLTGPLPPMIGSWADFIFIDVSENFLTGPIPAHMCRNGKMKKLLLLQNKFSGGIPETYADCPSLTRLRVNNNSLSGIVPAGIWGLPNLSLLDVTDNHFEGPITSEIGQAKSLKQLLLSHNHFSGELPVAISESTSLVSLQLSFNEFTGHIPATIGNLTKLGDIQLENNLFSGSIPKSLGSCSSLYDINLAGNSFSGEIPPSLGYLRSLNSLNLSRNKISGEIPDSFSSLRLSVLDLSNNLLTGRIPDSLSVLAYNAGFAGNPGLCSETIKNLRQCSSITGKSSNRRTVISCFVIGAFVLVLSLACFIYVKYKPKNQGRPIKSNSSWDMKQFHTLNFTEEEVLRSIRSENLIGKGGSSNVYKVTLSRGKQLAVKHVWKSDSDDRRNQRSSSALLGRGRLRWPEYDAEVAALSSVRHVNVVKLYCSITSEDANVLVYEYLPNGSLWDRLHTCQKKEMDWAVRYEIALGAARGLEYLHHGCDRPVIHRDVKSSNILLDQEMRPKIADFGLARIAKANGAIDSTHVIAGTLGYMAPEYAYTCKVNEKSDVYSFGVVLMELVTGRRPVEPEFGENKDIVQWVCGELRNKGRLADLVDETVSKAMREDAESVLRIAVHCTMRVPSLRPSMRMVVQMLEEAEPCKLTDIVVNQESDKNKR